MRRGENDDDDAIVISNEDLDLILREPVTVEFGVAPVVAHAWRMLIRHLWPALLGFVLLSGAAILAIAINNHLQGTTKEVYDVVHRLVISPVLIGACCVLFLQIVNDEPVSFAIFGQVLERFISWMVVCACLALLSLGCGIPGDVYVALTHGMQTNPRIAITISNFSWLALYTPLFSRLYFAYFLVAEYRHPWRALGESWQMTRGLGWPIFGISLLLLLLGAAGILALGIGIIFTIPLMLCGFAALYIAVKES